MPHFRGLPPELTNNSDLRERLPSPVLLTIEEMPDGVFLTRYADDGSAVGDTWHITLADAQQQAHYEFGDSLSEWKSVPPDVKDPVSYGLTNPP